MKKNNRRAYAGACFLLAMKFNECESLAFKDTLGALQRILEVDKDDILQCELPVYVHLAFKLFLRYDTEIEPHLKLLIAKDAATPVVAVQKNPWTYWPGN